MSSQRQVDRAALRDMLAAHASLMASKDSTISSLQQRLAQAEQNGSKW